MAPYQVEQNIDDDDDEMDTSNGIRVMSIAFSQAKDEAAYAVVIDGDGAVTDYIRLPHLLKRKRSWREEEREQKVKALGM